MNPNPACPKCDNHLEVKIQCDLVFRCNGNGKYTEMDIAHPETYVEINTGATHWHTTYLSEINGIQLFCRHCNQTWNIPVDSAGNSFTINTGWITWEEIKTALRKETLQSNCDNENEEEIDWSPPGEDLYKDVDLDLDEDYRLIIPS